MTIAELKIGTVISYNDMANVNNEHVILNTEETRFGTFVNTLNKETNNIEKQTAHTVIDGKRWKVIANA